MATSRHISPPAPASRRTAPRPRAIFLPQSSAARTVRRSRASARARNARPAATSTSGRDQRRRTWRKRARHHGGAQTQAAPRRLHRAGGAGPAAAAIAVAADARLRGAWCSRAMPMPRPRGRPLPALSCGTGCATPLAMDVDFLRASAAEERPSRRDLGAQRSCAPWRWRRAPTNPGAWRPRPSGRKTRPPWAPSGPMRSAPRPAHGKPRRARARPRCCCRRWDCSRCWPRASSLSSGARRCRGGGSPEAPARGGRDKERAQGNGRGERIRTSGLYVPNVALYQAKLHPEDKGAPGCAPESRPNSELALDGKVRQL